MNVSLILPAYNESRSLRGVVRELCTEFSKVESSFEIIIVDNGSSDGTDRVLDELRKESNNIKTVRVYPNRGFGNGILAGLKAAEGDIVGWAGADGQLLAEDIVKVYKGMASGQVPFAKGERIQSSKNFTRKVQSMGYTTAFRAFFGPYSTDVNGTPKFLKRSLYEQLHLESLDWFIDSECILKAARLSVLPLEIPVVWKEREEGYTNVNLGAVFQFLRNMYIYKFKKHF